MHFYSRYSLAFILLAGVIMSACSAEGDDPGVEYAPQMYHTVPYEPLTQIKDRDAGQWLSSNSKDDKGEFYNSNPLNPHEMTMRKPAPNTIRRTENGMLPITIPADSVGSTYWLDYASVHLKSPYDSLSSEKADAMLEKGTALFNRFCYPCHGGTGKGDGPVGKVIKGVPNFSAGNYATMTKGHIFHVITYGKGRMQSYASQLDMEERWKIIEYVKTLQKQ